MKHGMNPRRNRNGRNNGKHTFGGGGGGGNRSYESNGPDVKVRGTANQIFDKYLSLARDATSASDRIAAESYYQHAEHYYRLFTGSTEGPRQSGPRSNDPSIPPPLDQGGTPQPQTAGSSEQPSDAADYQQRPQQQPAPSNEPQQTPTT
ncbi:MAG: DUF4167 domain-containing protein [Alphaproteobacteria bacterium]|nr:DUF4167 domain-containing protein [Alphaproteobacteria bacterium]